MAQEEASPYATGGGGVVFEHHAFAICLAKCLMGNRLWQPGPVTMVKAQQHHTGARFDDMAIVSGDSDEYMVETQVRHSPQLTSGDQDFRDLVRLAMDSLETHADAFSTGRRQLALLVSRDTRNADYLAKLTEVARAA